MSKIDKLKRFLQENYPNEQAFNTRNIAGDSMERVYDEDGHLKNFNIGKESYIMKEKTADEMFEELGYEIIKNNKTTLNYEKEGLHLYKEIVFELLNKSVTVGYGTGECCDISMQELQAINKKCQEKGWIE